MGTTMSASSGGVGSGQPQLGEKEVQKGWAFAIRPPRWPVARTPRQRGGVRVAGTATETHVVLCAEDSAERIFFVRARDGEGKDVACQFVVEAVPRVGSTPAEVVIGPGAYVERRLDPTGAGWSGLSIKQIDSLAPGDPVLARYLDTLKGTAGGGGNDGAGA